MRDEGGGARPPLPRLAVQIGVTGHRRLAPDQVERLRAEVGTTVDAIVRQVEHIADQATGAFATDRPGVTILSQLAAGADQMVAQVGLDRGCGLRAVLPFSPECFAEDFRTGLERETFATLLDRAGGGWHLPGDRADADQAYALAGEATVAQSDLLIAIWDGATARGPGGTGDVVDYAIRRGVPVIHVAAGGGAGPTLLWAGIDDLPSALLHRHNVPRRAADADTVAATVDALLRPPAEPAERAFLRIFAAERRRRLKLRPEYPLMLAATGVRSLRRGDFQAPAASAPLDALDEAYCWADGLADFYAQIYRSGSIFNFVAAATAILVGLLGFLLPAAKVVIVLVELGLIGLLVVNTSLGNRGQWHRRWLDYRFLAETLRVMRSLKHLSVATARPDAARGLRDGRWTDFYAASLWRQLAPTTIADAAACREAIEQVVAEIEDQIGYHRSNAGRMHKLDHHLHQAGSLLFHATIATGLISLTGIAFDVAAITDRAKLLTFLSAALPTLGTALFGIRGQGDFAGAAGRSGRTATRLERSLTALRQEPITLGRAARILEDAAGAMLDDLGEWRAAYMHRKLLIPA